MRHILENVISNERQSIRELREKVLTRINLEFEGIFRQVTGYMNHAFYKQNQENGFLN